MDIQLKFIGQMDVIKFELSETESEAARAFIKEHKDCCMKKLGKRFFSSIGGEFTYTIIPTGLGLCTRIQCNSCGASKDITDTNNW